MNNIVFYIVISELISLFLLVKIWKSKEVLLLKIPMSLFVLIPFVGPLFYFFIADNPNPQPSHLRNNNEGVHGTYTHSWISTRSIWKKIIRDKEREIEKKQKDSE